MFTRLAEAALCPLQNCFRRRTRLRNGISDPCRVSLRDVKTSDRDVNVSEADPGSKAELSVIARPRFADIDNYARRNIRFLEADRAIFFDGLITIRPPRAINA